MCICVPGQRKIHDVDEDGEGANHKSKKHTPPDGRSSGFIPVFLFFSVRATDGIALLDDLLDWGSTMMREISSDFKLSPPLQHVSPALVVTATPLLAEEYCPKSIVSKNLFDHATVSDAAIAMSCG